MSKSFVFNAWSDNRIKTFGLCRNQIEYFRDILTDQNFFREPRSMVAYELILSYLFQFRKGAKS